MPTRLPCINGFCLLVALGLILLARGLHPPPSPPAPPSEIVELASRLSFGDQAPSVAVRDQPRAALVALVDESQLEAMLLSMRELESSFNHRYRYTWVFFSREELSEQFKQRTSNASKAACAYEIIEEAGLDPVTGPGSDPLGPARREGVADRQYSVEKADKAPSRWASGIFARGRRLRDYDWFWKVEPGTPFSCDVDIDVFRYMESRGIRYGFNQDALRRTCHNPVWRHAKAFVRDHPELLSANTVPASKSTKPTRVAGILPQRSSIDNLNNYTEPKKQTVIYFEGTSSDPAHLGADLQQLSSRPPREDTSTDAWTTKIWGDCKMHTSFEIGSLAFLRSPQHLALLHHLEGATSLQNNKDTLPLRSISASVVLPKESVWSIGGDSMLEECDFDTDLGDDDDTVRGGDGCMPLPGPTPDPEVTGPTGFGRANRDDSVEIGPVDERTKRLRGNPSDKMTAKHVAWELLADGLLVQQQIPGLMSGNTVVDARNFMLGSNGY